MSANREDEGDEVNIPEEWKLVPVKPTREMLEARWKLCGDTYSPQERWEAMLAAAPTPPTCKQPLQVGVRVEHHPVASILRDICESEPDNPDSPNTVCIDVDALRLVLERHIPQSDKLRKAAEGTLGRLNVWANAPYLDDWIKEKMYIHAKNLRDALEGK